MSLSRRLALLVAALSLGAAILAACASTQDQEVRRLQARSAYEQGIRHLSEGRLSFGLASLNEAVQLDPDNPLYRNALGVVQLDLKKPAEAQVHFERAIQIDPEYAEAHHNLGLANAEQGRFEQAIALYRKALSFPTYRTPEVAYYNLGNVYLAQGRFREAGEAYRAALQLAPTLVPAHYRLGQVLVREGRRDEAKAAFQAARDLEPDSPFGRAAAEALRSLGEGG